MNALERLARANELRDEVANVNRVRTTLRERAPDQTVAIFAQLSAMAVSCEGQPRIEAWGDVREALTDGEPRLAVRVPAGTPPADLRACLEQIAVDYETSFEQITVRAEELASEILHGDDIPF